MQSLNELYRHLTVGLAHTQRARARGAVANGRPHRRPTGVAAIHSRFVRRDSLPTIRIRATSERKLSVLFLPARSPALPQTPTRAAAASTIEFPSN